MPDLMRWHLGYDQATRDAFVHAPMEAILASAARRASPRRGGLQTSTQPPWGTPRAFRAQKQVPHVYDADNAYRLKDDLVKLEQHDRRIRKLTAELVALGAPPTPRSKAEDLKGTLLIPADGEDILVSTYEGWGLRREAALIGGGGDSRAIKKAHRIAIDDENEDKRQGLTRPCTAGPLQGRRVLAYPDPGTPRTVRPVTARPATYIRAAPDPRMMKYLSGAGHNSPRLDAFTRTINQPLGMRSSMETRFEDGRETAYALDFCLTPRGPRSSALDEPRSGARSSRR